LDTGLRAFDFSNGIKLSGKGPSNELPGLDDGNPFGIAVGDTQPPTKNI